MLPRYASSFCRRIRFGLCRRWLRHPRSAQFMVQPKKQFLISLDNNQKDNFDLSEYQAWQSGSGLRNLLTLLNGEYPGHVYLLGHSMGNVTVGEALRLSGATRLVNTYVSSQAALSAHTVRWDDTKLLIFLFWHFILRKDPQYLHQPVRRDQWQRRRCCRQLL